MTVPNILTVTRIVMTPIFAVTYIAAGGPEGDPGLFGLAIGVFIIAFLLDVLDGFFARSLNQTSGSGVFLDPLADKLLITTALVLIIIYDSIPIWIVGIVVGKDVLISGGWFVLRRYGLAPEINPSRMGKTALVFQVIAIAATMVGLPQSIRWIFWAIALCLTLITGMSYAYRGLLAISRRSRVVDSSQSSQVA